MNCILQAFLGLQALHGNGNELIETREHFEESRTRDC